MNKPTLELIKTSLLPFAPKYAADYSRMVQSIYDGICRRIPNCDVYGKAAGGAWTFTEEKAQYRAVLAPVCTFMLAPGVARKGSYSRDEIIGNEIVPEKLEAAATKYGEAVVLEFANKLTAKFAELDTVEPLRITNYGELTVKGTRAGRTVVIEQIVVMKVSCKGTPFMQYPARIYVDGKFYPEAKYKKLFTE